MATLCSLKDEGKGADELAVTARDGKTQDCGGKIPNKDGNKQHAECIEALFVSVQLAFCCPSLGFFHRDSLDAPCSCSSIQSFQQVTLGKRVSTQCNRPILFYLFSSSSSRFPCANAEKDERTEQRGTMEACTRSFCPLSFPAFGYRSPNQDA